MNIKEELIFEIATEMHASYCEDELRDFFNRVQRIKLEGRIKEPGMILQNACFENGVKRNDIILDTAWLSLHESQARMMFDDYEIFKNVVASGGCDIKDFAKRNLTEEEIREIKNVGDYRIETGEENILRPFKDLSQDSKKENLSGALGAYQVYEDLAKAGITIHQMETDPQIRNLIGAAIHTDWLKRNMDHENNSLKIPYNELDEQGKEQDLTVFNALLKVVKQNGTKYIINPVPNHQIQDYIALEQEVLSSKKEM